jgi:hypothetical protein
MAIAVIYPRIICGAYWMPVIAPVIGCDRLTSLLAYVALKFLRRRHLATV